MNRMAEMEKLAKQLTAKKKNRIFLGREKENTSHTQRERERERERERKERAS